MRYTSDSKTGGRESGKVQARMATARLNQQAPPADPSVPRPSWRTRLAHWAFASRPADRILKRRATYLVETLQVAGHVKPGGVYVDVGSGTGHNSVRMAQVAQGLRARFICIEPVSKPTRRVLKRVTKRTDRLVQFVRSIGNRLPLPDRHADGASVFFVLHHIPYDI